MQGAIDRREVPGAVVLVLRDGVPIHRQAYGLRAKVPDEEAMTIDTVFDLASLTKPVATATAVMILVEERKLSLSDPVAKHLPKMAAWKGVTLEHLLLHTSGLPPDHAGGDDDLVATIGGLTPLASPGERFVYSDLGYLLLQKVVEKVAETPLDQLTTRVFLPLGMRDTGFLPDADRRARAAPTEKRAGVMLRGEVHDPRAAKMGGVAGHAGLFGTADDLGSFATMLLGNGSFKGMRVLAEATVKEQLRPRRLKPRGTRALGWDVDTGYSHPRGDKFPKTGFGHTGFTGTSMWIDPPTKTVIVVLASRLHPDGKGDAKRLRIDVANAVFEGGRKPSVVVGLDVLRDDDFAPLAGKKIGLLTHRAATAKTGETALTVLKSAKDVTVVTLFSPEHGMDGDKNGRVGDRRDADSGLPVYSLYGDHAKPTAAQLAGLDAIVVDLVDVGARFFTYESTLALVLEAAATAHLPVFVLDRPNPLGGVAIEGPTLDAAHTSFVGIHPLPVRHGLTMGELARLFVKERNLDVDLKIVSAKGWKREAMFEATGLPWTRPSPNLISAASALLYPGVALLEMTNVSVGRGTETPFSVVGAPWLDGDKLGKILREQAIPGLSIETTSFTPTASTFVGQPCGGVRFTVTDAKAFPSVRLGFALIAALRKLAPKVWEEKGVDMLLGGSAARAGIDRGQSLDEVVASWDEGITDFRTRRASVLLYELTQLCQFAGEPPRRRARQRAEIKT